MRTSRLSGAKRTLDEQYSEQLALISEQKRRKAVRKGEEHALRSRFMLGGGGGGGVLPAAALDGLHLLKWCAPAHPPLQEVLMQSDNLLIAKRIEVGPGAGHCQAEGCAWPDATSCMQPAVYGQCCPAS